MQKVLREFSKLRLILRSLRWLKQSLPTPPPLFPSLKPVTHILQWYNDETWNSYALPEEEPKYIWMTWHTPLVLLTSPFFHRKSANFAISDCILVCNFFYSLKIFLIKRATILMMWVKLATTDLLKIKIFWNKGYDVIILDYNVTKGTLHVTQIILQMWLCDPSLVTLILL